MRLYTLHLDRGPAPWFTGICRNTRYTRVAEVHAKSRRQAVSYFRRHYESDIKEASASIVVCEGRV